MNQNLKIGLKIGLSCVYGVLLVAVCVWIAWEANLFLASMAMVGGIFAALVLGGGFKKSPWSELIPTGMFALMIAFAIPGAYVVSEKISWPELIFRNPELDEKIKKAQTARKASEEEEKAREIANKVKVSEQKIVDDAKADQRELLDAMKNIAENTLATARGITKANTAQAETNATLKAMRKENEERHLTVLGRFDSTERGLQKIKSPEASLPPIVEPETVAPTEQPKIIVPPLPESSELETVPPLEWKQVPRRIEPKDIPSKKAPLPPKAMPKPEEIQPAEPQPKIEHRAKVTEPKQKKGRPNFVICSCGKNCAEHEHEILRWHDSDGNGAVEPVYLPCFYAETGKVTCSFKKFLWK